MRNRRNYPPDWKQRAQACKERAGWMCEKCGYPHGVERLSYSGRFWPVYLQAAHVNHDPHNPDPELVAVCPSCHYHYFRKPGTRPRWMIEKAKHQQLLRSRRTANV